MSDASLLLDRDEVIMSYCAAMCRYSAHVATRAAEKGFLPKTPTLHPCWQRGSIVFRDRLLTVHSFVNKHAGQKWFY